MSNTPAPDPQIKAFTRERNAMLLALDVAAARKFHAKWNPNSAVLDLDDAAALAAIHKARTGCRELPEAERRLSIEWLAERALTHYADDLAPL